MMPWPNVSYNVSIWCSSKVILIVSVASRPIRRNNTRRIPPDLVCVCVCVWPASIPFFYKRRISNPVGRLVDTQPSVKLTGHLWPLRRELSAFGLLSTDLYTRLLRLVGLRFVASNFLFSFSIQSHEIIIKHDVKPITTKPTSSFVVVILNIIIIIHFHFDIVVE